MVIDSGANRLVRFGIEGAVPTHHLITARGSVNVGTVASTLLLHGRTFWRGRAIALPRPEKSRVAGLLPASVFKTVYVCNSARYVVVD